MRGTNREKYLKSLEGLNEYERLLRNLETQEFTITHLELAYREYIRRRKDIPEGARNLLCGSEGSGSLQFASTIKALVGNVHLAYMRGRQEGNEVPEKDWEGIRK